MWSIEPLEIISKKFDKSIQLSDSCLKWLAFVPNHHGKSLCQTLHELCAPVRNALEVVVPIHSGLMTISQQKVHLRPSDMVDERVRRHVSITW
jgi:hypothetical protein